MKVRQTAFVLERQTVNLFEISCLQKNFSKFQSESGHFGDSGVQMEGFEVTFIKMTIN